MEKKQKTGLECDEDMDRFIAEYKKVFEKVTNGVYPLRGKSTKFSYANPSVGDDLHKRVYNRGYVLYSNVLDDWDTVPFTTPTDKEFKQRYKLFHFLRQLLSYDWIATTLLPFFNLKDALALLCQVNYDSIGRYPLCDVTDKWAQKTIRYRACNSAVDIICNFRKEAVDFIDYTYPHIDEDSDDDFWPNITNMWVGKGLGHVLMTTHDDHMQFSEDSKYTGVKRAKMIDYVDAVFSGEEEAPKDTLEEMFSDTVFELKNGTGAKQRRWYWMIQAYPSTWWGNTNRWDYCGQHFVRYISFSPTLCSCGWEGVYMDGYLTYDYMLGIEK